MTPEKIEDLDPSIRPIVERAWQAFMEGERMDSVEMTEAEFEILWRGLGYQEAPTEWAMLYGIPIVITHG